MADILLGPLTQIFPDAKVTWWDGSDESLVELVGLGKLVNFAVGGAALKPGHHQAVRQLGKNVRTLPGPWSVRVIGAASRSGSYAVNEALSRERALAVKTALVGQGVADGRFGPGVTATGEYIARGKGVADGTEDGQDRCVYVAVWRCNYLLLPADYRKALILRAEAEM